MTLTKKVLITTTALTLSAGMSYADNNEAYIDQLGNNHSAIITQDAGSNNKAGSVGNEILQRSQFTPTFGNTLSITQNGDDNEVGLDTVPSRNSGFFQFNQSGPGSTATVLQDTNGNVIGRVNQVARTASATGNTLTVTQDGGDNNEIGFISQDRSGSVDGTPAGRLGHTASITQTGNNNFIALVRQGTQFDSSAGNEVTMLIVGDNNGGGSLTGLASVGASESSVVQSGTSNTLDYTVDTGNFNQFGFLQDGDSNMANGLTITGDRNELGIIQTGDMNEVSLASIDGSDNVIGFSQTGESNLASATIMGMGSNNEFAIMQNGFDNDASIMIDGDDNGATSTGLFGVAALVGGTNGVIAQWGDMNDASLSITGSNNAFALAQGTSIANGNNNLIMGTVDGDDNAVAVAQGGDGNTAVFTQTGNGNSLGIIQ